MKLIKTKIDGVVIIEPDCYGDDRGWFMETYNKETFAKLCIYCDFVQDNMSYSSKRGTFRGLHYQIEPYAQAKLVRCTKGAVLDFAVDLRKGSVTYGQWVSCELSAENKKQFFLPRGMAHGFLTLTDDVEFQYKCDGLYNKNAEGSVRYNDPTININFKELFDGDHLILSEKDKVAPLLQDCNANFIY